MNKTLFGRRRFFAFRSHEDAPGFTGHLFVMGRDENGRLERDINTYRLWARRIRRWCLAAEFRIEDGALGGYELEMYAALPFIFRGSFAVSRAPRLVRWLGVEYRKGKSLDDNSRVLGFSWDGASVSLSLWSNSEKHWDGRFRYINLRNKLLGYPVLSERAMPDIERRASMTDVDFTARIRFVEVTRKRPRWPRPVVTWSAVVEIYDAGMKLLGDQRFSVAAGSVDDMLAEVLAKLPEVYCATVPAPDDGAVYRLV